MYVHPQNSQHKSHEATEWSVLTFWIAAAPRKHGSVSANRRMTNNIATAAVEAKNHWRERERSAGTAVYAEGGRAACHDRRQKWWKRCDVRDPHGSSKNLNTWSRPGSTALQLTVRVPRDWEKQMYVMNLSCLPAISRCKRIQHKSD